AIKNRSPCLPSAPSCVLLAPPPIMHSKMPVVFILSYGNKMGFLTKHFSYAPWCPACQNLQPEWESFAEWSEDLEVNIAKVDVTEQPGKLFFRCELNNINCKDGEFRRYQGPRTKSDFINFISEQEWKSVEPISSWLGPSSFLMSSMSALFQLSMWIRQCHTYFTENLGIPNWGSYAIFAFVTLFLGLLLGLIMVFLADCVCPSKKQRPYQHPHQSKYIAACQVCVSKWETRREQFSPSLIKINYFLVLARLYNLE
uniref:Thioredoxin related transmembrane protein 1 n=1 Tax=Laticauda laticaudata TaxID=8630 RepID=A0A8C5WUM4_LATLA